MTEKINNLNMVSIGKYYPCEVPFECNFKNEIGLDHLETKLFRHGSPLRVIGFWAPTNDHNYMRVVADTSEIPVEINPFMRMQIFLDRMDDTAKTKWLAEWEKELKRQEELMITRLDKI
jgi:hypothetical protein